MSNVRHIQQVIKRAKHQRSECIGNAVQAYALPMVFVAGLSLMLLQLGSNPPVEGSGALAHAAQVTTAGR